MPVTVVDRAVPVVTLRMFEVAVELVVMQAPVEVEAHPMVTLEARAPVVPEAVAALVMAVVIKMADPVVVWVY
jgi:hypothetical protein